MAHLILLLPVLGLLVFWLLPVPTAIPVYVLIVLVSIAAYVAVARAMRSPVETGAEGIVGRTGEVVEPEGGVGRVRVEGEIWHAVSSDELVPGDRVEVVAVEEGLTLRVRNA
jgi:membrane-bound serine protease (ClpP class)